jgi:hypothetical protein
VTVTRDLQLGKLTAIATFSNVWPELARRLAEQAAVIYRAGLEDGLSGGVADIYAGEHDARRRVAATLDPILDGLHSTARTIYVDINRAEQEH